MKDIHVSPLTLEFPVDGVLYLFNPLSGAFDRLPDKASQAEWTLLKSTGSCSPAFLEALLPRGYVYEREEDEKALMDKQISRGENLAGEAVRCHAILSYDCNLRCTYCYEDGILRESKLMDPARLERMLETIDGLSQTSGVKETQVVLFGGEPLLTGSRHEARIRRIMEYASESGWEVDVVTNGVHLRDYVALFKEHTVSQIQVTLDGPKRIHDVRRPTVTGEGTFDQITESVDAALAADLPVVVRVNADKQNIDFAPELARFFDSSGWLSTPRFGSYWGVTFDTQGKNAHCESSAVMLRRILETRKSHPITAAISLEAWESLQFLLYPHMLGVPRLPKFFFCGAQRNEWCFDLYGDVYFCADGVGRKEFRVGSYDPVLRLEQDKASAWREHSILSTRSGCEKCPARLCCGGGCSFRRVCAVGSHKGAYCTEHVLQLLTITAEYLHRTPEVFRQQEFTVRPRSEEKEVG